MLKCAVFASGGGSNFQALIDRKKSGDLIVDFKLLICNNPAAGAIERAKNNNIKYIHLAPSHFSDEASYIKVLLDTLKENETELIILAGYMKKIPQEVIAAYPDAIINIHPALLPAFGGKGLYGEKVHQAVLDYGAKISGVTIHYIDGQYDHGPVIYQQTVPVLDSDDAHSLAGRVLELEHDSYWKVVAAIAGGAISVKGRRVYGSV
ncbi:MAG TPA: phosphoribosylglycinamide formyltransferase [Fibrobacteres bacterium]|jgi:phosphoribosylglycinamide formyltransferase 1|nr:phosphoribosylglycinamide formyltransferase [Fibrobacterota bacterium]